MEAFFRTVTEILSPNKNCWIYTVPVIGDLHKIAQIYDDYVIRVVFDDSARRNAGISFGQFFICKALSINILSGVLTLSPIAIMIISTCGTISMAVSFAHLMYTVNRCDIVRPRPQP